MAKKQKTDPQRHPLLICGENFPHFRHLWGKTVLSPGFPPKFFVFPQAGKFPGKNKRTKCPFLPCPTGFFRMGALSGRLCMEAIPQGAVGCGRWQPA